MILYCIILYDNKWCAKTPPEVETRRGPISIEVTSDSSPWRESGGSIYRAGLLRISGSSASLAETPVIKNLLFTEYLLRAKSRWLSGKEPACQCRRRGFSPWVRKFPWIRKWWPTPVFFPGKSHRQRKLEDYSPRDHKESDTNERLNNKKQCSKCLKQTVHLILTTTHFAYKAYYNSRKVTYLRNGKSGVLIQAD